MVKIITDTNFSEIIETDKPLLIDFWAAWCGPCRILTPTVDEIAEEFGDKDVVAKCNVDDAEEVSFRLGIRNIPTLLFIKNGQVVYRSLGVISKAEIESKLNSMLEAV